MIFLTQILIRFSFGFLNVHNAKFSGIEFYMLCLSTICIAAGGYIINDIFDVKTDLINKPKEVYITTSISKTNGVIYYIALTTIGVLLGVRVAFSIDIAAFSCCLLYTSPSPRD